MALSLLVDGLGHAHSAVSAADRALGACGLSFGAVYLGSRALGVLLDAFSVALSFHLGERTMGYIFLAHMVCLRGPMLLLAPLSCCGTNGPDPRRVRAYGRDPNAVLYWRGSFFSALNRLTYEAWQDRVITHPASFFWVSLFCFAALVFVDVGAFCLAFILRFRKALDRSYYETGEKVPQSVSLTLGLQGALMWGGLVTSFAAYHAMVRRRRELLHGGGRGPLLAPTSPGGPRGPGGPGGPAGWQVEEPRPLEPPCVSCGDCCAGGAGPEGGCMVRLAVVLGYVAFVGLITGVFAVGCYFFYAFVVYYY